ncbi:hypothetical protein [Hyphomonas sp.]|jgi:hypothetical protein|uniref:hypothetical protein n=1 Tax=Hyphomonas sp. TaxID=87 RepID=UPI0037C03885
MLLDRRLLLLGSGFIGLAGCATANAGDRHSARPSHETKAIELTFLRSVDPDPERAAQFIKTNWFAMDAVAQSRGLMTFFNLHVDPARNEDWNLAVQVGYPHERGFDSIRTEWAEIVAAHKTVLIDGKRLVELATIVGTRRLLPA